MVMATLLTSAAGSELGHMLAGRTLYVVNYVDDHLEETRVTFDSDFSSLAFQGVRGSSQQGTTSVEEDGDYAFRDGYGNRHVVKIYKKDYIELADYNASGDLDSYSRVYYDQTKADAYYDFIDNLNLSGKTFYVVGTDYGEVEKGTATFSNDLSTLTFTPDNGNEENENIKVAGNVIVWLDDMSYSIIGEGEDDSYIEFVDYDSNLNLEAIHRLYGNETNASVYYSDLSLFLTNLLDTFGGKTFYVVGQDLKHRENIWYGKLEFSNDMTGMYWTELGNDDIEGRKHITNYAITLNKIVWGDEQGAYSVPGDNQGDYYLWYDYDTDETLGSITRSYSDQSKAESYYDFISGGATGLIPIISILLQ